MTEKTNLQYKGFKSTRLVTAFIIFAVGTALLLAHSIDPGTWKDLVVWVFGTYGLTEGIAKSAEAYKNRGSGATFQ